MSSVDSNELEVALTPPPIEPPTYAAHASLIERVIASTCRQHRLRREEAEDFTSWARERLLDGRALSSFQGRCRLQTFVIVVVRRLFLDFRNARWGKYRPSAEAKRLGATAVILERLLVRDGHTFDEAEEILRTNYRLGVRAADLYALASQLPVRIPRRLVGEEALEHAAADTSIESEILWKERQALRARVYAAVADVLRSLQPQDRLLLKMRFEDGMKVTAIAQALRADQRLLYRRLARVLQVLRTQLLARGVSGADAADVLGRLEEQADPEISSTVSENRAR